MYSCSVLQDALQFGAKLAQTEYYLRGSLYNKDSYNKQEAGFVGKEYIWVYLDF